MFLNKNFKIAQTSLFCHLFEQSQVPLERKLPGDSENGAGFSFLLRLGWDMERVEVDRQFNVSTTVYYTRSPGGIYQNSSSQPHIQQFHWFIKLDQILKKTLKILIGMVYIWKRVWSKFNDFYKVGGWLWHTSKSFGWGSDQSLWKLPLFPYWSHPRGGQFIFIVDWVIKISVVY